MASLFSIAAVSALAVGPMRAPQFISKIDFPTTEVFSGALPKLWQQQPDIFVRDGAPVEVRVPEITQPPQGYFGMSSLNLALLLGGLVVGTGVMCAGLRRYSIWSYEQDIRANRQMAIVRLTSEINSAINRAVDPTVIIKKRMHRGQLLLQNGHYAEAYKDLSVAQDYYEYQDHRALVEDEASIQPSDETKTATSLLANTMQALLDKGVAAPDTSSMSVRFSHLLYALRYYDRELVTKQIQAEAWRESMRADPAIAANETLQAIASTLAEDKAMSLDRSTWNDLINLHKPTEVDRKSWMEVVSLVLACRGDLVSRGEWLRIRVDENLPYIDGNLYRHYDQKFV
jgi:hypothetical protein